MSSTATVSSSTSQTAGSAATNVVTLKQIPETKEHKRLDYQPSAYQINHVDLDFALDVTKTKVASTLHVRWTPLSNASGCALPDLILDGENFELDSVAVQLKHETNVRTLNASSYVKTDHSLIIPASQLTGVNAQELFSVFITVYTNPTTNTELMGLYKAGPILCTQCEPSGFRRVTYFIDRPDVLATYTVRLEASKQELPILLSNGNLVDSGMVDASSDRHYAVFEDPFVKPSYLFAIVAGDLVLKESEFVRMTGRPVRICLWTESKYYDRLDWALDCIKKAMQWDEQRFGRVYDLDIFNIVAVSFFNMGAMENKSLNIFNAALLLASPMTSTDAEFERILAVVGHEYFHNWTGNRVTCRDWFQLTLKEGLTVYRDQEFSSDMGSRAVQRIAQARVVLANQFTEDSGPMAHPIRPETYVSMENLYTMTVYRKGAEVVRMYATLLGDTGFRNGMDLYFALYDGCAVTCDDFRDAMSCANAVDLSQFERWYLQAGTPVLTVQKMEYDASGKKFLLRLRQHTPPTPKQPEKLPFHIPVAVGLLGRQSTKEIVATTILELTEESQDFIFENVTEKPVASILRNFSAPVCLEPYLSYDDLGFLLAYDTDPFNRWSAAQRLMSEAILNVYYALQDSECKPTSSALRYIVDAWKRELERYNSESTDTVDTEYLALLMEFPSVDELQLTLRSCDPVALHSARESVKKTLGCALEDIFKTTLTLISSRLSQGPYAITKEARGQRWLRKLILNYLSPSDASATLVPTLYDQYVRGDNMTDRLAALSLLTEYYSACKETRAALDDFLVFAKDDELLVHKWLAIQAGVSAESTMETMDVLKAHPLFDIRNPNAVRALFGRFTLNTPQFHRNDGRGYRFIAQAVLDVDPINGSVAARLATALTTWAQLDAAHQDLMLQEVKRLSEASARLSTHVRDVVEKTMAHYHSMQQKDTATHESEW